MEQQSDQFRKIVVGVDLSPPALIAVGQAMSMARSNGAPLVLMMVEPEPEAAELLGGTGERTRFAADRVELEELRQRLIGQGVDVSHVVTTGEIEGGLADGAARMGADLVVVGTHGHHGMRRMLLGSVAEMTVRLAASSVLVARGATTVAEGGYRRILVGTDFSAPAELAIARAVAVAAPGATIELMHACHLTFDVDPEGTLAMTLGDVREALLADALRAGGELASSWRQRGVRLGLHIVEATPREALAERASALGADLVVVGSHGRRGLRRFVLGSVAEATVRESPCSVLVVR
jgi:nucleotide-binding universal stress UspA family protein